MTPQLQILSLFGKQTHVEINPYLSLKFSHYLFSHLLLPLTQTCPLPRLSFLCSEIPRRAEMGKYVLPVIQAGLSLNHRSMIYQLIAFA